MSHIILVLELYVSGQLPGQSVAETWSGGGQSVAETWSGGGQSVAETWSGGGQSVAETCTCQARHVPATSQTRVIVNMTCINKIHI